jgi:thioredoxin-dependent peroxiredoxin
VVGNLPSIGEVAPDFTLTTSDLKDSKLTDYKGKTVILNIFPSVDTPTCSIALEKFNDWSKNLDSTKYQVLCISADLPFAQSRFCGSKGIKNVTSLSSFRNPEFGKTWGVAIANGPLKDLCSRAVVVINPDGKIAYTEQVAELSNEPNYQMVQSYVKP